MSYRESMHKRLDLAEERFQKDLAKLRRQVDQGKLGGEEDRLWLDMIAKRAGGRGFDICCGDFLVEGAEGIDGDTRKLGVYHHYVNGENLTIADSEDLDFIVTNYFDVFPNPLAVLMEWNRTLRSGGTLALVCRDAEQYSANEGPLSNRHRCSAFTAMTIMQYLSRAGFENVAVEKTKTKSLRVWANKP